MNDNQNSPTPAGGSGSPPLANAATPKRRSAAELRSIRIRLLEFAAACFLALAGFSTGHLANLFLFIGLLLGALALRLFLLNHHRTKAVANRWSLAIVVVSAVVSTVRSGTQVWARKPHLILAVRSNFPGAEELLLTNKFLFVDNGPEATVPNSVATLVVWIPAGSTNASLKFLAINDSAFRYEVVDDSKLTVEAAHIRAFVIRGEDPEGEIRLVSEPNWIERESKGGTVLSFAFNPLLPGNGDSTPTLTFTPKSYRRRLLLLVSLRGKEVPETSHLFYLMFLPSQTVMQPTLLPPGQVAVMLLKPAATNSPQRPRQ